jgi:hypothetical protein
MERKQENKQETKPEKTKTKKGLGGRFYSKNVEVMPNGNVRIKGVSENRR